MISGFLSGTQTQSQLLPSLISTESFKEGKPRYSITILSARSLLQKKKNKQTYKHTNKNAVYNAGSLSSQPTIKNGLWSPLYSYCKHNPLH